MIWWDALGEMKNEAIKRIHIASMRAEYNASDSEMWFWVGNITIVGLYAMARLGLPVILGVVVDRLYLYMRGSL